MACFCYWLYVNRCCYFYRGYGRLKLWLNCGYITSHSWLEDINDPQLKGIAMYKHFIWDFDGTLFDSYPPMVKAYHEALKEQGIKVSEEEILRLMKISVRHLMAYSKEHHGIDGAFSERFAELREVYEQALFEPYKDIRKVLKEICDRGGSNHIYTHRGSSTGLYLEKYKLLSYFDEIVTSDNGFPCKPDPEGVQFILESHNIDPDTAVLIGDRALDILSAQKAGIKGCFYSERPEYTCDVADYLITEHLEILTLGE